MVCDPAANMNEAAVAVPFESATADPFAVLSTRNCTVPVGVPVLPEAITVAVGTNVVKVVEVGGTPLRLVAEATLVTTRPTPVELEPAKLVSPR